MMEWMMRMWGLVPPQLQRVTNRTVSGYAGWRSGVEGVLWRRVGGHWSTARSCWS